MSVRYFARFTRRHDVGDVRTLRQTVRNFMYQRGIQGPIDKDADGISFSLPDYVEQDELTRTLGRRYFKTRGLRITARGLKK